MKYYVDGLASSLEALHGSFQLYRVFGAPTAQNQERKTRRLTMPVLAMGGAESGGAMAAETMKLVANDVHSLSSFPALVVAALAGFLDQYRDGSNTTR